MPKDTLPHLVLQYCPSCGQKSLNAEHQEDILTCTECEFVMHINPASAVVAIIVNENNELLLTVRDREPGKGKYDLPGGFVDVYESMETALQREIMEELNLEVTAWEFIYSAPNLYQYKGLTYHTLDSFFICKVKDLSTLKCAKGEITTIQFFAPDDLPMDNIGFPSVEKGLEFYCQWTMENY